MKKLITLLLLLCTTSITLKATDFEYDGIYYTILDEAAGTCQTRAGDIGISGNSVWGNVIIPSKVEYNSKEYTVVAIGDYSFKGQSIDSMVIPNTVTSIGVLAFVYCTSMRSVVIPESVTSIGQEAFSHCGLFSVEIPNSITTIDYSTFASCPVLSSVKIPNSVTTIRSTAFSSCGFLKSIEIPNSVTTIEQAAFELTGLTSIKIPDSVTSIAESLFSGCKALTSIEIPESVTSIENYAFDCCKALTSIEIPKSVTEVGYQAFVACNALESVYCYALTPPSITKQSYWSGGAFDKETYTNATLYVPGKSIEDYKNAEEWKNFIKIKDYATSSITDAINPEDNTITVFNLQGIKQPVSTRDQLNTLAPGYYIVNNKKILIK